MCAFASTGSYCRANVRITRDPNREVLRRIPLSLDAWVARPVTTTPGIFDDSSHRQLNVWGAYVTRTGRRQTSLDGYYLGWGRRNASFDKGVLN